jgi:hypothetical protein
MGYAAARECARFRLKGHLRMGVSVTAAFIGAGSALAVAIVAALGVLFADWRKREGDRRGVASAMAGEIDGILHGTTVRQQAQNFQLLANALLSNTPPPRPWVWINPRFKPDPVLNAYVGRIGELGGDLPGRIARFYTVLEIIRADYHRLAGPEFANNPRGAGALITADLTMWRTTDVDAQQLVLDLRALSSRPRWHFW